jgi:hypothetical protein
MHAISWSGVAVVNLFVIGRDEEPMAESDFEVSGMRPDRVEVFPLRDDSVWDRTATVREYDLVFDDPSAELGAYVEACLRRAGSPADTVAWAAFEGSFHFGHLLTDDIADQIYGLCVNGRDPVVIRDSGMLNSEGWRQQVRQARACLERAYPGAAQA